MKRHPPKICRCPKPGIVSDKTYCFDCHRPTPAAFEGIEIPLKDFCAHCGSYMTVGTNVMILSGNKVHDYCAAKAS